MLVPPDETYPRGCANVGVVRMVSKIDAIKALIAHDEARRDLTGKEVEGEEQEGEEEGEEEVVVEEEEDDAYLERAKNKWEGRLYFPNSKKMGKELEVPLLPHPSSPHPIPPHPIPPHPIPSHPTPSHPTPPHPTPSNPTQPHPTPPHSTPPQDRWRWLSYDSTRDGWRLMVPSDDTYPRGRANVTVVRAVSKVVAIKALIAHHEARWHLTGKEVEEQEEEEEGEEADGTVAQVRMLLQILKAIQLTEGSSYSWTRGDGPTLSLPMVVEVCQALLQAPLPTASRSIRSPELCWCIADAEMRKAGLNKT